MSTKIDTLTINTRFLNVIAAIVRAAGQQNEYETADHFHLRVENEPFMPLVIESWPIPASDALMSETRRISVALMSAERRPDPRSGGGDGR